MANYIYTKNCGILVNRTLLQENPTLLASNTNNVIRKIIWCIPPSCTLSMTSVVQSCVPTEGDTIKVLQNDSTTIPAFFEINPRDIDGMNLLDLSTAVKWSTSASASYILFF